jgi:hypothetical protein
MKKGTSTLSAGGRHHGRGWAERMAHKSVILLASARGEADEVAWKVSLLEGELVVACGAQDTIEAKLLGLVDKARR